MSLDLEQFRKIPRNDLLIYLHQNKYLNNHIKIHDLYDRINKPNNIFCMIIDDLLRLKLIVTKNYISLKDKNSFIHEMLIPVEISLTIMGEDYVESMLLGYNLKKYEIQGNPLDTIQLPNFGGWLTHIYLWPFENFIKYSPSWNPKILYYLCTGKEFKENKEKKIFISYSWDSDEHKKWIEKLALKLAEHFHVEYDKNLKHAMSPKNYMKHNVLSSDFVLIVFTPKYLKRINKDGSGVQIEYQTINDYLIADDLFRKIPYGKYLPILKEGSKEKSIPTEMQDSMYSILEMKNPSITNL